MQQEKFETTVREVRARRLELETLTADIRHYIAHCPPLRLANIELSGFTPELSPMYEVTAPAVRGSTFSLSQVSTMLSIVDDVRRKAATKKQTFRRGELKLR